MSKWKMIAIVVLLALSLSACGFQPTYCGKKKNSDIWFCHGY